MKTRIPRIHFMVQGAALGIIMLLLLGATVAGYLRIDSSGWSSQEPIFARVQAATMLYSNSLQAYSGEMVTCHNQFTAEAMYVDDLYADWIRSQAGAMLLGPPPERAIGTGYDVWIASGMSSDPSSASGSVSISAAPGGNSSTLGGNVHISAGSDGSGGGTGNVILEAADALLLLDDEGILVAGLPVTEPAEVGRLWIDGVTIKVSDGP